MINDRVKKMANVKSIISPMGRGNGAFVLHKMLEGRIEGYRVHDYNPRWEYFPFAFPFFFRKENPSLIHTTLDYGFFFHRKRVPLVLTVHHLVLDSFMKQYSSWPQRIHYKTDLLFFTRLSIEKADTVTAVSKFTADMVRNELGFTRPIRIIYNGIETERFLPGRHFQQRKVIRALFAGNLSLRKGVNLLPEIAKKLPPNIEIVYTCGLRGGSNLPDLPNLRNLGRISNENMPDLYRESDILLF
ncbi:glycosyltransferase family 1 protein, partial [bacterium]|nr:glycosyltransferase family 1 protein [bacterium]